MRIVFLIFFVLVLLGPTSVFAVEPDEVLEDPVLENRAREISTGLRCLVCQNQSIDDSDAPLAKDLRILVRERLISGDSDGQVVQYLVDRYGEFVLLKPRFALHTLVLWIAAPLLFLGGIFFLWRNILYRRRLGPGAVIELTEREMQDLSELLDRETKMPDGKE